MNGMIYLAIGILSGGVMAWVIATLIVKSKTIAKTAYDEQNLLLISANTALSVEREKASNLSNELEKTGNSLNQKLEEAKTLAVSLASRDNEVANVKNQINDFREQSLANKLLIGQLQTEIQNLERNFAVSSANLDAANTTIKGNLGDIQVLKSELQIKTDEFNKANTRVAELSANNNALSEKLETQKTEIEAIKKQFHTEFENIATKILDEKTKKFTDLNRDNLETILKPLDENLKSFKQKVEEVYDKEAKERFSLGKEVEKLVLANQKISEEANNLTNALTTKGKTQGDWGQMILETILEKSGLVKDREYFIQEYLKDDKGEYLYNDLGNRMQPDVIIAYPDNRKVIVDSKVSLTAYNRYTSASSKAEEEKAMAEHLRSIRKHIDDLSAKSYQDFAPSLDFVMMFVPIEPAYLMAIHADQDLWMNAYNKRILLTSPSNLIVALKMIVDFWKRDSQDKNHQAIVERGGKLYDKFAMVLESLKDIGSNLKATQKSYSTAINQLSEGNDNVLRQVEKLKVLGAKTKKNLPAADSFPLTEHIGENDEMEN